MTPKQTLFSVLIITFTFSIVAAHAFPIKFQNTQWEPLSESPVFKAPFPRLNSSSFVDSYCLIQFQGPIRSEWKEILTQGGVQFYDYVPEYAFIARIEPYLRDHCRRLPFVRWIGEYPPEVRIESRLLDEGQAALLSDPVQLTLMLPKDVERESVIQHCEWDLDIPVIEKYYTPGNLYLVVEVSRHYLRTALENLANIPGVFWIEEVRRYQWLNEEASWVCQSMIEEKRTIWRNGLWGQDQILAICDTGLDIDHCFYWDSKTGLPNRNLNLDARKVIAYHDWVRADWDGEGHGTHVAGCATGDQPESLLEPDLGDGMAPAAKLIFQDVGYSNNLPGIPRDLGNLFSQVYEQGATIHSDSWGGVYNIYSTHSRTLDEFCWNNRDFIACFAQGNDGPNDATVHEPATAKNCIAVGGTENGLNAHRIWNSSSRGPAADGRMKPTIVVPASVNSARGDRDITTFNCNFITNAGTSMATPIAAGLVALLRQYITEGYYPTGYPTESDAFNPHSSTIIAAIAASGERVSGVEYPGNDQGWGRILLENVMHFPGERRDLWLKQHGAGMTTGDEETYTVAIVSGEIPLKLILAWTDPLSLPAAQYQLVNNLDLELEAPNGDVFFGNVFNQGQSVTGGTKDTLNNIEGVILNAPQPGIYTVRVKAENIPQYTQSFSLAMTGDLADSSGQVSVSKSVVNCDTRFEVHVTDGDLTGTGTTTVEIASDTETTPEVFTLTETPRNTGHFLTQVMTDSGSPTADGKIQVRHDDNITITYIDAVDGRGNTDVPVVEELKVDCRAPSIFNVQVKALSDSMAKVSWYTSEPASGKVHYGPTSALGSTKTSSASGKIHEVVIDGLNPCSEYYFAIYASDSNGNSITDNNQGQYYKATTTQVMLDFSDDLESGATNWTSDGNWILTQAASHSPTHAWYSDSGQNFFSRLLTPPIALDPNFLTLASFWTRYDMEYQWDGGSVGITMDGGATVTRLTPLEGYPGVMSDLTTSCVGAGQPAFTGQQNDWTQYTFSLEQYKGLTVQLIFEYCTDNSVESIGWYVDDLQFHYSQPCGTFLSIDSVTIDDTLVSCTDGDGIPDAGETISLECVIGNWGSEASEPVIATMSTTYMGITVMSPAQNLPALQPNGGQGTVTFTAELSDIVSCGRTEFLFEMQSGTDVYQDTYEVRINQNQIAGDELYIENVDLMMEGWNLPSNFEVSDDRFLSPNLAIHGNYTPNICNRAISPPIKLSNTVAPFMSFFTIYYFEPRRDGAWIEISTDNGLTWTKLSPVGDYLGVTDSTTSACVGTDKRCFTGRIGFWKYFDFNLALYRGETVRFGFSISADGQNEEEGWYIEDINVYGAEEISYVCDLNLCADEDTTPPGTPVVTDMGDLSNSRSDFSASWTVDDPESGIVRYMYSIGSQPGLNDQFGWQYDDSNTSVNLTYIRMATDLNVFFNVRAQNGAGLWSPIGSSDGIFIDASPPNSQVTNLDQGMHISDSWFRIEGTADDQNGSGVSLVQLTLDGGQTWVDCTGTDNWYYDWNITVADTYRIRCKAYDIAGNQSQNPTVWNVTTGPAYTPTPTPTETWFPTFTPTVAPTFTPTETPIMSEPLIVVAGYMDTSITTSNGGRVSLMAIATDADGIEIYVSGQPTGNILQNLGDGAFIFSVPLTPGIPPTKVILGLVADKGGVQSRMWPYLEVK